MQPLKVSCEPWCVNEFDTSGVLVGKNVQFMSSIFIKKLSLELEIFMPTFTPASFSYFQGHSCGFTR